MREQNHKIASMLSTVLTLAEDINSVKSGVNYYGIGGGGAGVSGGLSASGGLSVSGNNAGYLQQKNHLGTIVHNANSCDLIEVSDNEESSSDDESCSSEDGSSNSEEESSSVEDADSDEYETDTESDSIDESTHSSSMVNTDARIYDDENITDIMDNLDNLDNIDNIDSLDNMDYGYVDTAGYGNGEQNIKVIKINIKENFNEDNENDDDNKYFDEPELTLEELDCVLDVSNDIPEISEDYVQEVLDLKYDIPIEQVETIEDERVQEVNPNLKTISVNLGVVEEKIDYKKLQLPKLRSIVVEKGMLTSTEAAKMKKPDLLKLLEK
jgi:hypothetical protein